MKKPAKKATKNADHGTFMLFDHDTTAEEIVKTIRKHVKRYEEQKSRKKPGTRKK
jgi:hypothetical protein